MKHVFDLTLDRRAAISPGKTIRGGVVLLLAAALMALGMAYPSSVDAQVASSDADLAGLALVRPSTVSDVLGTDALTVLRYTGAPSEPPLAVSLNEPFAAGTTAYTANVGDHVRRVLITPTPSDSNATVTVNGGDPATPVNLSAGANVINVLVTAEDGVSTKNYQVTVTRREYRLVDRDLTGLTVTGSDGNAITMMPTASHLSHYALHQVPGFYPYVTNYSLWVPSSVTSVTVTPTWDAGSDYWVEVRGGTNFLHPTKRNVVTTTRVNTSGGTSTTITLNENLLSVNEIWVGVHGPGGGAHLYFLDVLRGTAQDLANQYAQEVARRALQDSDPQEQPQEEVPEAEENEDQQQSLQEQAEPEGVSEAQLAEDGATSGAAETPPGPVQDLSLRVNGKRIIVSWNAPADGGAPSGYQVKLESSDGGKAKIRRPGAKKLKIVYRNLERGATYQVSVRAKNQWGTGAWISSQITVE